MLTTSPMSMARSSLEVMLESLQRADECEKPKDLPPALPARPTSRARLPTTRRSIPANLAATGSNEARKDSGFGYADKAKEDAVKRKEKYMGSRRNTFGRKRMKKDENMDSPYVDQEGCPNTGESTASRSGVAVKAGTPEWEENIEYFIKKKLRVWCRPANGKWELGTIVSTSGEEATVSILSGNIFRVSTWELLPANPDILCGVDDLLQLSYLNEPSVIYNLHYRFSRDIIYSKAGPLLIAVNPFKKVQIYEDNLVQAYKQKTMDNPHVYALANTAYNEMMRDEVSQSIIISGESGAGKTETARFAMHYLASVGGGSSAGIESNVLCTNSILEAFGNAKTSRNANSSRFGKFTEIYFSVSGKICGAKVQTFFLEKSRVVQVTQGERSYHIFYQLCAGAPSYLREKLNLRNACEYYYLKQSSCLLIEGVNDAERFRILLEALDIVRIPKVYQENAFEVLAAILWLGNISFHTGDFENHAEVVVDEAVTTVARLLGCTTEDLMVALSTRKIKVGKDHITKTLTLQQAFDVRDALAKFLYASLFDWVVEQINISLEVGKESAGRSINILDICGFESFQRNSFEQFCINYANERLQQHFHRHLFKLEQEEYETDGIYWTKVDFEDNQDCLNLIEKRPLGILSLGDTDVAFTIRHYAGEVSYDSTSFLQKNRDLVHVDSIQLLSSCSCQLPKLFAARTDDHSLGLSNPNHSGGGLDFQKQSVAAKLKGQLFKLMHQLENTKPHFIRCIRPNEKQLPCHFEEDLVLQQLRCCGIIEVVQISRSGYPSRMTHQEFAERYGFMLFDSASVSKDPLSISVALLHHFNVPPETYQVGYMKIYLRMGQVALLESRRKQALEGIIAIQKCYRSRQACRHHHSLKKGAIILQSFVRGELSRRKYYTLLKSAAASAPAARVTDYQLVDIVSIQSVIRGWLVRKQVHVLRETKQLEPENAKQNLARRHGEAQGLKRDSTLSEKQVEETPADMAELRRWVLNAESTLAQKEQENVALREQLQQVETKWSDYESRMKAMEETWQKQMASLQVSLATARKSLVTEDHNQPRRLEAPTPPHDYDSDTASMGSRTPGETRPRKYANVVPDGRAALDTNGTLNAVSSLMKEFELRRQTFDNEARTMAGARADMLPSGPSPDEELRNLKVRFETWKKDYKVRLRETKARLHKLGLNEGGRRKWWGKMR
ncbi:hypothetical protein MLD38_012684 [Melastoma candidum]|uniref:Uncharacterized protein n=1 Tax=Melastoma candidum TaxID=119954 RepID=A0ACB9RA80_9MYRT|nr:hypothetical protein MLD38_012684 [Melastoma candidum]